MGKVPRKALILKSRSHSVRPVPLQRMLEQFRAEMERFMRAIETIIETFAQGQLTGDRVDDAPSTSTSSGTGNAGSDNGNDAADGNNGPSGSGSDGHQ